MKFRTVLTTTCALVMLFGPLAGGRAYAQDVAGDKKQTPPATGKQTPPADPTPADPISSFLSGLNLGPMMMTMGGASGMTVDFTRSNERILLQRDDVRGELFLNSKQIEQLEELDKTVKQDMQQKMMSAMTESFQNLQGNFDPQSLQGGSPDQLKEGLGQLKEALNKGFENMQEVMQTFQGEMDKKTEALLTPKQLKRLHELDLQWRGPLALSDKKVAEVFKTTKEQNTTVDLALKDYMLAQTNALQIAVKQLTQPGPDGAPPAAAGGPGGFNVEAAQGMQQKITDMLQSDEMKKVRKKSEDKVTAVLTPDQKDLWKKSTGVKFYFRPQ